MTGGGEGNPLKGMSVLVPRGKEHAKTFSNLIKGYGGIPVEIPLIAFKPVNVSEEIIKIINQLHTYDWIIFTSNVTVETFLSFIDSPEKMKLPKIAAIGKRTEACLLKAGIEVDFIPNEYVAEGFVKDFLPIVKAGMNILIPKGNLARNIIYTSLTEKGANVDEVIMYETFFPDESRTKLIEVFSKGKIDILAFTSPSTVDHFMRVMKENQLFHRLENSIISTIGPITKDRIKSYGLDVHCEPAIYTSDHMLESIIEYVNMKM
ncbi:uroporphyrinogen-III synthase [Bacillus sp. DTU_2020_1000418_1_SI_GHA_SEK_038]|uniref:uroporphyrinogen-III synthase n=1 Tax=Bacillus sp. DTU_2020_1000418_1_SI_GHA_SEK_038 TaxID=3077585 RepID=UPI0028EEA2C4|nr:uroporphyrinogen-III synthase [Bacillus sp. DTU_2020_1000418_1_SI_GHA_SEK_038]WNS74482.1 uroporphyrinogen-III synthase [Bacillus sp. DTU_2020_1000418_1_SI_GHA_SEK_038]